MSLFEKEVLALKLLINDCIDWIIVDLAWESVLNSILLIYLEKVE